MEPAKLDPAAAERLKMLQLADLGTARREHISTTDGKKVKDIHPDHIEATRMTNLVGSEAQQAAQVNKARLAGWANVYKDIGDTKDLEHLDNLLDGQSHRARLGALIFASGGQAYTKSVTRKDNFLKVAETDYSKGHGRRPYSAGRGGGVTGTRGCKPTTSSPNIASARTPKQGAVMKISRQIVDAPGHSRLDPALDSNNDPHKSREEVKTRSKSDDGAKKTNLRTRRPVVGDYARILSPPESFLAIARSMINTKTSDDTPAPGHQTPETRPTGPSKESNPPTKDDRVTPEKGPDAPRIAKRVVAQPEEAPKTPPFHNPATTKSQISVASTSATNTPMKATTSKANVLAASTPSVSTPTKGMPSKATASAAPTSATNTPARTTTPKANVHTASVMPTKGMPSRANASAAPTSPLGMRTAPKTSVTATSVNTPTKGTAPKANVPAASDPSARMPTAPKTNVHSVSSSPANVRLNAPGIFISSAKTPVQSTVSKANSPSIPISSANMAAKGTAPKASVSAASVPPANEHKDPKPTSSDHPEESSAPGLISKQVTNAESNTAKKPICQLQPSASQDAMATKMESEHVKSNVEKTEELLLDFGTTPPDSSPLSDFMASPAIQDLEGIDFRHSPDSVAARGSTTIESTESPEQPSNGPSIADYQREISLLSALLESTTLGDLGEEFYERLKQCKKELEELCQAQRSGSSAVDTPVKHERISSISPLDSASVRLRQAVTVPPFCPRVSSFSGYRSPTNSISSDSTAPPPTPVPIRRAAIPIRVPPAPAEPESITSDHIFGDHLLPGRRSHTTSSLREVSPTSRTSSDEPSTTKVGFSNPPRETVLKNVDIPIFESKAKAESSTQPEASNNVPLPKTVDSKSPDCSTSSASGKTLEMPKNRPTPQVISSMPKTEPAVSTLTQSIHAAQPPAKTHVRNASSSQKTELVARVSSADREASVTPQRPPITTISKGVKQPESMFTSMSQSIHVAPKEPPRQPVPSSSSLGQSVHPHPQEVPATRQPVLVGPKTVSKAGPTLGGIMSSRYAS